MALSDVGIWAELGAGRLRIDPRPEEDRVGGSSIDLLLHPTLIVFPESIPKAITVDPAHPDFDVMQLVNTLGNTKDMDSEGPHELLPGPGNLVLGRTLESLELPPHLAGRIEGKSSLARLGLAVHVTAPTVQAGFKGRLYLEMYNYGPFPIKLTPRMDIAQLILEHLGLPARDVYHGRFQGQL
jgi:dCTP deaminase